MNFSIDEEEKQNLEKLKILADQMARLGLNFPTDISTDIYNNINNNNNIYSNNIINENKKKYNKKHK